MMMGRAMMSSGWENWDNLPDYMQQMMQSYWGGIGPFWALSGILDFAIQILWIILLIAAIRWLWMKGGK